MRRLTNSNPPMMLGMGVGLAMMRHSDSSASVAAASVDGLIEASRQSRVCGGVANEIQCRIFLILMEARDCPPTSVVLHVFPQFSVGSSYVQ